jgi:hypothetical protein
MLKVEVAYVNRPEHLISQRLEKGILGGHALSLPPECDERHQLRRQAVGEAEIVHLRDGKDMIDNGKCM